MNVFANRSLKMAKARQVSVNLRDEEEERIKVHAVYREPLANTLRRLAMERCDQLDREKREKQTDKKAKERFFSSRNDGE